MKNKPGHHISFKIAYTPSEDSDHPAHSDQSLYSPPEYVRFGSNKCTEKTGQMLMFMLN